MNVVRLPALHNKCRTPLYSKLPITDPPPTVISCPYMTTVHTNRRLSGQCALEEGNSLTMIGWLGRGALRNMSSSSSVSGGGGRGGGTSPPGRGGLGGAYSVMSYIRFMDIHSVFRITSAVQDTGIYQCIHGLTQKMTLTHYINVTACTEQAGVCREMWSLGSTYELICSYTASNK